MFFIIEQLCAKILDNESILDEKDKIKEIQNTNFFDSINILLFYIITAIYIY